MGKQNASTRFVKHYATNAAADVDEVVHSHFKIVECDDHGFTALHAAKHLNKDRSSFEIEKLTWIIKAR